MYSTTIICCVGIVITLWYIIYSLGIYEGWWKKILRLKLFKRLKSGDSIPLGLSKKYGEKESFFLRIPTPIFLKRLGYNIETDKYEYGWYRIDVLFKFLLKTGSIPLGKQKYFVRDVNSGK